MSMYDAKCNGKEIENAPILSLYAFEKASLDYFTEDDRLIESIERGTVYLPNMLKNDNDIKCRR